MPCQTEITKVSYCSKHISSGSTYNWIVMSYCEAVKAAAESGCFGDGILGKIELQEKNQSAFQASSDLFFVKIRKGNVERLVVVKIQPFHTRVSEEIYRNTLFVNEVCFYSKLLPFLFKFDGNIINFFPKYYYGCATFGEDVTKDAVIVEDLSPMGFNVSNLGRELDVDHITLILKSLGKFHALSYKAKKESPIEFRRLLSDLKNDLETVNDYVEATFSWAIMYYQGTQNKSKLKDKCNIIKNYNRSIIPKEPYSVLCHGDMCSNNILFSYNKTGKPEMLKFIDLQRCRYGSPAIDLSFFLLYNTTSITKTHWDFFLNIYYESLRTAYTDVTVPSFSEFMEDFITHIIYGISTCSYFFPIVSLSPQDLNEYLLMEKTEKMKVIGKIGGEKAKMLINEMFQLVLSKGYL